MLSRQEVNTMRHLANAQYCDRPAGGNTGRLFLAFGGPVCTDWISNCPLDRVLTYKNLIYLLNLQFDGVKEWISTSKLKLNPNKTEFIVSTGAIRWILWFSVCYAAATYREIFDVNTLSGNLHQLGSPNLRDIFIGR